MAYEKYLIYWRKYKRILLLVLIVSFFIILNNLFAKGNEEIEIIKPPVKIVEKESTEEKPKYVDIYVDIKGAVNAPGVYQMFPNARVIDVVNAAGGLHLEADPMTVNLSQIIVDQMVIIIPFIGQEILEEVEIVESKDDGLTNLNTASLIELTSLPGIGEARAQDIINYRNNNLFEEISDIMNVSGIGPAIFEQIKNLVTI